MADLEQRADISWEADPGGGVGTIWGASGGLRQLVVNWLSRTKSSGGWTAPEELLAAAHASSYAMALAKALEAAGAHIQRFDVSSTLTLQEGSGDAPKVRAARIGILGNVGGVDEAAFASVAEKALGDCPITQLLKVTAEITVEPTLREYRVAAGASA